MEIDSFALVLVTAGILLAIAVAVLVGQATARLFFHASRGHVEDAVMRLKREDLVEGIDEPAGAMSAIEDMKDAVTLFI